MEALWLTWLDAYLSFLYRVKLCIIGLRQKSTHSGPEGTSLELPIERALGSFLYAREGIGCQEER